MEARTSGELGVRRCLDLGLRGFRRRWMLVGANKASPGWHKRMEKPEWLPPEADGTMAQVLRLKVIRTGYVIDSYQILKRYNDIRGVDHVIHPRALLLPYSLVLYLLRHHFQGTSRENIIGDFSTSHTRHSAWRYESCPRLYVGK